MAVPCVLELVGGIKFRIFREKGEVKDPDMDSGPDVFVIIAAVEVIESAAQVAEGAFHPVSFVDDLHLKVDEYLLVQFDPDVKDIVFAVDILAQFDGVGDYDGTNLPSVQVESGADECCEHLVVPLHECAEEVVIGHAVGKGTFGLIPVDV